MAPKMFELVCFTSITVTRTNWQACATDELTPVGAENMRSMPRALTYFLVFSNFYIGVLKLSVLLILLCIGICNFDIILTVCFVSFVNIGTGRLASWS